MKLELIKKYLVITLALFISAFCYNVLVSPINLVAGGISGVAIIIKNLFSVPSAITIFVLYFVLLIVSFIYLGLEDTMAALFITIVYPLFVEVTSGLSAIIVVDTSNILLITIFAGFIGGITNGLIYRTGLNTGGLGVLTKILHNRKKIAITKVSLIINLIIVLVGGYIFGVTMILYAVLYLVISKMISDKLLFGISSNKMFYIISDDYLYISNYLKNDLHHDVTLFDILGKYSATNKKMIMVVVPTSEYFLIKEAIKDIDSKAFVFASDSYETKGQDLLIRNMR